MPLDSSNTGYEPSVDFSSGNSQQVPFSTEHGLAPENIGALEKVVQTPDWILGVILIIVAVLAWIRVYHLKRMKQLFQALLYKLHVYTILRSNDSLITSISVGLNTVFVLTMSLFVYLIVDYKGIELPFADVVNPFIIILPVVLTIYPVKSLLLRLLAWILKDDEKFNEYIFNVFLMNKFLGLALVPIVILVSYLSFGHYPLFMMGLALIVLAYLYRLLRGYSIARSTANLSQFYIFLYLCTLEILPMVVITRLVSREI